MPEGKKRASFFSKKKKTKTSSLGTFYKFKRMHQNIVSSPIKATVTNSGFTYFFSFYTPRHISEEMIRLHLYCAFPLKA